MSDAMTGGGERAAPGRGRGLNTALWLLQVLVAVSFASAAIQKLAGTDYMVTIFSKIGFGAWFRYAIGLIELAGAVALVIPVISGAAAAGLMTLVLGGTVVNMAIGENPLFPLIFALFTLPIAWGRRSEFSALARRFRPRPGRPAGSSSARPATGSADSGCSRSPSS